MNHDLPRLSDAAAISPSVRKDNFPLLFFVALLMFLVLGYGFSQVTTHAESTQSTEAKADTKVVFTSAPLDEGRPETASDVLGKALAFKATLTAGQQAQLQQAYTPTLARNWSHNTCG